MNKAIAALVTATSVVLALAFAGNAFAWHAEGVTVSAACDRETYTYVLSATIQGSSNPGEFVKSITPATYPGDTTGTQPATVVIGWANSNETQTWQKTVTLEGECTPPPPVDVCKNLEGNQETVPPGYELIDGECVHTPPPPPETCASGTEPNHGQDGNPGNDKCNPCDGPIDIERCPHDTPPVTPPTPPTTPTPPTPPAVIPPVAPPVKEKPVKEKPKPDKATPDKAKPDKVKTSSAEAVKEDTLPFTGLPLLPITLLGAGMSVLGWRLRKR